MAVTTLLLLLLATLADAFLPLYDQHFGLGILPVDLLSGGYYRPWFHLANERRGVSKVVNDKDTFKVLLDVQHFKPDELTVKVVQDQVQVEGRHEARKDEHGSIARHFVRHYSLPEDVEAEALVSELSSDGVLTISAPKKAVAESQNERIVPITQTNTPVLQQTTSQEDQTAPKN